MLKWMRGLAPLMLAMTLTGCSTPTSTQGPTGTWLAFGDSITQQAFERPTAWPAVTAVGLPGATSAEAVSRFNGTLSAHPDAKYVALGFGTNDAFRGNLPESFASMMRVMVERARQAGKNPMIARVPYGSNPKLASVPAFNAEIAKLDAELGLKPGPDLYTWFKEHPEELQADGIHPTAAGCASIQRLWAEKAQAP